MRDVAAFCTWRNFCGDVLRAGNWLNVAPTDAALDFAYRLLMDAVLPGNHSLRKSAGANRTNILSLQMRFVMCLASPWIAATARFAVMRILKIGA